MDRLKYNKIKLLYVDNLKIGKGVLLQHKKHKR